MTGRIATVVGARAAIGGVLIGVPAALVVLAGDPLPSWAEWSAMVHLEPDWGNTVLLGSVLPCLAWITWALFAYPLIGELVRHLVGRPVFPVGVLLRGQQQAAAALVAAAVLSSSPAFATPRSAVAQPIQVTDIHTTSAHAPLRTLHAPARDAEPGPPQRQSRTPAVTTYEVRAGDTLWGIAEHSLGDGADYPAIVDESVGIMQPDGRHLSDPDLILPGWQLDIPIAARATPHTPSPAASAPQSRPSATPTTSSHVHTPAGPAPAPASGVRTATAIPDSGASSTEDAEQPAVSLPIGGGVAAIFAAGLITVLTRRRRRQRTARRYGHRIPLPADGPERDGETQLRAVSDPDAVSALHRAFAAVLASARQATASLPSLFAVRIDENDLTLYLHEPATLPDPFRPLFTDRTAWTASRDSFTVPANPDTAAPYPALVTVGTDLDGGILLLDLEQQAHLSITSPDAATARSMLNAITAELASTPWGDDIHLSLVDLPDQLPMELDPYRIHSVPDTATLIRDLRTHLADRRTALDAAAVPDIRTARIHLSEVESWAPFVVLVGSPLTLDEQVELDDLAEEHATTGLVIVTLDTAAIAAEITVTDTAATFQCNDATLPPLPFTPQLLEECALAQVLQIFTRASAPAQDTQPESLDSDRTNSGTLHAAIDSGATHTERAELPATPVSASSTVPQPASASPADFRSDASHPAVRAPYIRLLGQVEVERVDMAELLPGRGVELLAYLLTVRQPVAGAQIQKALWPTSYDRTNGNLRTLAKQVRAALGHDPDGHLWLPEGRGNAGFTTHPAIRSDWHDFTDLTSPDPAAVPTEQLVTALRIVRGQPLLGTDGHRGRWAWRAPLEETIIAAIQDAATVLAERAIEGGDRELIKLAVRAARFADPLSELSWQIELRATTTSRQVERIVADLHATAGYGNPDYEPDLETLELIQIARSAVVDSHS